MAVDVTIPATDGLPVSGTEFGNTSPVERVVLIAPATGVRRRLYKPFAEFLAGGGFRAERTGHFGFFRPSVIPTLWRDVADWLARN